MKKIIILIVALVVMSITWYALAKGYKFHSESKNYKLNEAALKLDNGEETNADFNDDEKQILKEYQDLFKDLSSKTSFYIMGNMEVSDLTDSSGEASGSGFSFLKTGNNIYYQNNYQQILNTGIYYVVADLQSKKMIVAPPKTIQDISPIPFSAISKNFKSEGYTIERTEKENKAIIKMVCENNINCKEIRVEFDPLTRKPSLLFYRFTDLDNPEGKKFDKTIAIHITKWDVGIDKVKDQSIPKLVTISKESITVAAGFDDYEIINLYNQ